LDGSVHPNNSYHYFVTAVYYTGDSGESRPSDTVVVYFAGGPILPPFGLQAFFADSVIQLGWNPLAIGVPVKPPFPLYFKVYRRVGTDTAYHFLDTSRTDQYTDRAITANTYYGYYVTAVAIDSIGGDTAESAPSNKAFAYTGAPPNFPPPTNLQGQFVNSAVALQWQAPSSTTPPVYYTVYRKNITDTAFVKVDTTSALTYADRGVVVNMLYGYYVTAEYNDSVAFESRPSNIIFVLTGRTSAVPPPIGLQGVYDRGMVDLAWYMPPTIAIYPAAGHFNVYRKGPADTSFSVFGVTSTPHYTDSSVSQNALYHYYVTAVYADTVESNPSNIVDVFTGSPTVLPPPPLNLVAGIRDSVAVLEWQQPQVNSKVIYYKVYRAVGVDSNFVNIGNTTSTYYTDKTIDLDTISFYFVTGVYFSRDTVESGRSNIVRLPLPPPPIQFTSPPVVVGMVGQQYQYTPVVVTNPPGQTVCFSLWNGPRAMTIDPNTGMVQWTPVVPGVYGVTIVAHICDSGFAQAVQSYNISVLNGAPSLVEGTVKNDSGRGIGQVHVYMFDVGHGLFVLGTLTDSTGAYQFANVNPSVYLLRATPDSSSGYAPQWYNGVQQIQNATPVTVAASETVAVNFTLLPPPTPPLPYTISGLVTDTSGNPLKGANVMVTLAPTGSQINNAVDGNPGGPNRMMGVQTDSSGNYSITLPANSYLLSASERGYLSQFWNDQPNPLDANTLVLGSDTSGINFRLTPRAPRGVGVISGTIFSAADSTGLPSVVAGFQKPAAESTFTPFVVFAHTDSLGNFSLQGLPPGYYVVLAIPAGTHIPTFYSSTGGTPFLDSATAIAINADTINGITIYAKVDSIHGLNSISGIIGGHSAAGRSTTGVTSAESGVLVTVSDSNGTPVSSSTSQSDGSYTVTGLGSGSYTIVYQEPGYNTNTVTTNVSYNSNSPSTVTVNTSLSASSGGSSPAGLMNIRLSWNLLSLPVTVPDARRSVVFPDAITDAYHFNPASGYVSNDTLSYASGFWVKFPLTEAFVVNGTARTNQVVQLSEGWNLIGSLTSPLLVDAITTVPSGLAISDYFSYNGSYTADTAIQPGSGYWVKSSGSGTLTLNSSKAAPRAIPRAPVDLSQFNMITVGDASGSSQKLYFGVSNASSSISKMPAARFELPPVPPAGVFDARFASNNYLETTTPGSSREISIAISTVHYPVTISWGDVNGSASLVVNGKTVRMTSGSSVQIANANTQVMLKLNSSVAAAKPTAFALSQNYPNPFNPSTIISYALPADAKVTLKVYNVIGQVVATLVDGVQTAGFKTLQWNAANLASGVYFYRIEASSLSQSVKSFVQTKKMVIVR
jgi:fibronectin type 3 domain-containing protein